MHLVTWKTKYLGAWNIRYLGTWNTRYIWVLGTPCVLFPEDQRLGRLPVSSLLSPLFHMSCMTLESDKMFHKLKAILRRKIRTMLMRKGWSTLGRVFWKSVTPARCNIYTVTATTIEMAVNLGLVRVLHLLVQISECDQFVRGKSLSLKCARSWPAEKCKVMPL